MCSDGYGLWNLYSIESNNILRKKQKLKLIKDTSSNSIIEQRINWDKSGIRELQAHSSKLFRIISNVVNIIGNIQTIYTHSVQFVRRNIFR